MYLLGSCKQRWQPQSCSLLLGGDGVPSQGGCQGNSFISYITKSSQHPAACQELNCWNQIWRASCYRGVERVCDYCDIFSFSKQLHIIFFLPQNNIPVCWYYLWLLASCPQVNNHTPIYSEQSQPPAQFMAVYEMLKLVYVKAGITHTPKGAQSR